MKEGYKVIWQSWPRNKIKNQIEEIVGIYDLQIINALGSRGKEALELVEERPGGFSPEFSDLDIGIKPERHLKVVCQRASRVLQMIEAIKIPPHRRPKEILPRSAEYSSR